MGYDWRLCKHDGKYTAKKENTEMKKKNSEKKIK